VSHSFSYGYTSESEFGKAIEGIDTNEIIKLMDELMDAVKVMNPRLYEAVMRKIKGIA
jgi:hypothetical protein